MIALTLQLIIIKSELKKFVLKFELNIGENDKSFKIKLLFSFFKK